MYQYRSRVRYSECSADSTITLSALVNYLQDCCTFQSEDLGIGVAYQKEIHCAWVLSSWQIVIEKLPVMQWNYKSDNPDIKHIGPVAQDFYTLFGLGNDNKSISSIDPSGIALIGIKELSKQNYQMKEEISRLALENNELKQRLGKVEQLLEQK